MNATILENQIPVRPSFHLDHHRLTIDVPNGWDDVKKICKKVLEFDGRKYVFTGWNSDSNQCYFIESANVATVKAQTKKCNCKGMFHDEACPLRIG